MGPFHHHKESDIEGARAYETVQNAGPHKAHLSHEVLAAAAAYEATKAHEKHEDKQGNPQSHHKEKEAIAGLAVGMAVHEAETKGDKEKARR